MAISLFLANFVGHFCYHNNDKIQKMPKFYTSVNLPCIKPNKTVCAILVEAIMRNNSVKLF